MKLKKMPKQSNEGKEQRGGFLSVLLCTLGAGLLGNILAGKGINRAGEGIFFMEIKKYKKQQQKDSIMKTKWIFNVASSFN